MKDKIKVVGMLEGWPFAVKEEPTVVELGANKAAKGMDFANIFKSVFGK